MSTTNFEASLALEFLREDLNLNPSTDQEHYLNEMRIKFRTYIVEFYVNQGALKLPGMFVDDFGDELGRFTSLTDKSGNQFEVLVDRIGENVYLTHGWSALRDFYGIEIGAWLHLIYAGMGQFGLIVFGRSHKLIPAPIFDPPLTFVIDKTGITSFFDYGLPDSAGLLSYRHSSCLFHHMHDKALTYYDVCSGFLMLPYNGFGEFVLKENVTSIKVVDECRNLWNCTLVFVTFPFKHYKVGGDWGRIVDGRRLAIGNTVIVGAEENGCCETLYLIVER